MNTENAQSTPAPAQPAKHYPTVKYKALTIEDPGHLMHLGGGFVDQSGQRVLKLPAGWHHTVHAQAEFPMQVHQSRLVQNPEEEEKAEKDGFTGDLPDGSKAAPTVESKAADAQAENDALKAEIARLKEEHAKALQAATKSPAITVAENDPKPGKKAGA